MSISSPSAYSSSSSLSLVQLIRPSCLIYISPHLGVCESVIGRSNVPAYSVIVSYKYRVFYEILLHHSASSSILNDSLPTLFHHLFSFTYSPSLILLQLFSFTYSISSNSNQLSSLTRKKVAQPKQTLSSLLEKRHSSVCDVVFLPREAYYRHTLFNYRTIDYLII